METAVEVELVTKPDLDAMGEGLIKEFTYLPSQAEVALTFAHGIRKLLSEERHWTRNTLARTASTYYNKNGGTTDPLSPEAVSWCLLGAGRRVRYELAHIRGYDYEMVKRGSRSFYGRLTTTIRELSGASLGVASFNDTHDYEQVIELLDFTIEKMEAKLDGSRRR